MDLDLDNTTSSADDLLGNVKVTEAATLMLAMVSITINSFLVYILQVEKSKTNEKTIAYHVITHISYFLIILSLTNTGFIVLAHINSTKGLLILYDTHNHLLLAFYSIMIMFGFNDFIKLESWCRHCITILWIITITMILYSISLIMCNDKLLYSFILLRLIAFGLLLVILVFRIKVFLYKCCVRVETEMLQSVLVLSFLCCWLPDLLFNVSYVDMNNLSVMYCIGAMACVSNVISNIILMSIVDEDFRTNFKKLMGIRRLMNVSDYINSKACISKV